MPSFLLVDDTNGRVLALFPNAEKALRAVERLEQEAPDTARFCLVRFDEHQGTVAGTETTLRLRSLT